MGPARLGLGPLTLGTYERFVVLGTHELFVVLGAVVAFAMYRYQARRRGMADNAHIVVALTALASGAIVAKGATGWRYLLDAGPDGASVYGLLAYGGKSILGGLFGAYAGALIAKRVLGIRHSTGDLFAPAVAAGMAVGRIGCLLTEPVGTPTTLPWAVALSPSQAASDTGCTAACTLPSHPSHAYEILFHLIALVLVLRYGDRLGKRGVVFTVWLLAYGIFRLGNEFLRDNPDVWLGLSGTQVVLLITIPLLARGLWRTHRAGLLRPPPPGQTPVLPSQTPAPIGALPAMTPRPIAAPSDAASARGWPPGPTGSGGTSPRGVRSAMHATADRSRARPSAAGVPVGGGGAGVAGPGLSGPRTDRDAVRRGPEILDWLERWTAPTKVHVPDTPGCFTPPPAGYLQGLGELQTQHTCILLQDLTDHCNLSCPTCFAESGPDGRHRRAGGGDPGQRRPAPRAGERPAGRRHAVRWRADPPPAIRRAARRDCWSVTSSGSWSTPTG